MINWKAKQLWFVTGSQHLYGAEALAQVASNSQVVAKGLNDAPAVPAQVVWKPVVTTSDQIVKVVREANADASCVGLIFWMHTFSPAKMWIAGLGELRKPFVHLHTQFNRDIPWDSIDMDFMNLNQSAHGGREFGYIGTRMGIERSVIVGHWQDARVQHRLGVWSRAAVALAELRTMKIARFADNMREVAVTEGDKVGTQIDLGVAVNGYGIGDLAERLLAVSDAEIDALAAEYQTLYEVSLELRRGGARHDELRYAARQELALSGFLSEGGFGGYTDNFQTLHGVRQLPGIASQRLMAAGYGFGAEGDWKTAALLRAFKVMADGLPGGTSFMEDYTYHFEPGRNLVLGAHMLEICPSIASDKPRVEIHPLSIGDKEDPVRLVFDVDAGPAINVALIEMGGRMRLILNEVDVVAPQQALPKLPVARALWAPRPNLEVAAGAWILAGGAHHTVFSKAVDTTYVEELALMAGIELLVIDADTTMRAFRQEERTNELYWRLKRGF